MHARKRPLGSPAILLILKPIVVVVVVVVVVVMMMMIVVLVVVLVVVPSISVTLARLIGANGSVSGYG